MGLQIKKDFRASTIILMIHVGLLVYALKIPGTEIPVYWFLYLGEAFFISLYRVRQGWRIPGQTAIYRKTEYCWLALAIIGTFVILITGKGEWREIIWLLCLPAVATIFCYISTNKNLHDNLQFAFIVITIALALFGIYESVTGNIVNKTAGSFYYRRNRLGFAAPNTIFFNINDHAVFMTMSFWIAWIYSEGRENQKLLRICFSFLYGFNVAMVWSYGALLSIAIFTLLYILVKTNSRKKRTNRFLLLLIILLFALSFVVSSGLIPEGMGEDRLSIWSNTIESMKTSPIVGVGPEQVKVLNEANYPEQTASPHNFFLEMTANYGLVGGGILIAWFIMLIVQSRREGMSDMKCRCVFCILVSFLSLSIVCSSLFNRSWMICFLALLIDQLNYTKFKNNMPISGDPNR